MEGVEWKETGGRGMDQVFSDSTDYVVKCWCNSRQKMCASADSFGNCGITGGCSEKPVAVEQWMSGYAKIEFKHKCPHCGKEFT